MNKTLALQDMPARTEIIRFNMDMYGEVDWLALDLKAGIF
jgi:hypothetical protein